MKWYDNYSDGELMNINWNRISYLSKCNRNFLQDKEFDARINIQNSYGSDRKGSVDFVKFLFDDLGFTEKQAKKYLSKVK